MTKLYQFDHPYYCNLGNYHSNECGIKYATWADFLECEGDSDMDYNLLFRWDWRVEADDIGNARADSRSARDPYYRGETLELFFMGQRKGIYRYAEVSVCRADEPEVRAWLEKRWHHMRRLWAPISGMSRDEAEDRS